MEDTAGLRNLQLNEPTASKRVEIKYIGLMKLLWMLIKTGDLSLWHVNDWKEVSWMVKQDRGSL